LAIGVIGCGVISACLTLTRRCSASPDRHSRAVADMRSGACRESAAQEFGVPGMRVDQTARSAMTSNIVVNLTVPLAHTDVSLRRARTPASTSTPRSRSVSTSPRRASCSTSPRRRTSASAARPDTFLGGGHQTAAQADRRRRHRRPRRRQRLLRLAPATSCWHPAPGFHYLRGGGPMLDMGPYYITDLVQLLGPDRLASWAATSRAAPGTHRRPASPLDRHVNPGRGRHPCRRHARIRVRRRRLASLMSFDVPQAPATRRSRSTATKGSILVPDPNRFGGEVHGRARPAATWKPCR
jgi:predicted dehydrogenase